MKVKDIGAVVSKTVPLGLAQDWDKVGLLVGDPESSVKRMLLTIDVTNPVIEEAKQKKCEMILSYHPVIWDGLKNIKANDVVFELIRAGIAVFSMHTALDTVEGGVNDALAEIIGIQNGKPIGDYVNYIQGNDYRLVVFVPIESINAVSDAVYKAGAGAMGNYSHCGFKTIGTGTFLPLQDASPAIGKKGRLEKVQEVRFETIVPTSKLQNVIAAMKKAHPYETPAYDVIKLSNNYNNFGLGRIGKLAEPMPISKIIEKIKKIPAQKQSVSLAKPKRLLKQRLFVQVHAEKSSTQ